MTEESPRVALSQHTVAPLLKAHAEGRDTASASLDLSRTQEDLRLSDEGVILPDGRILEWNALEEVSYNDGSCWVLRKDKLERVQIYSETYHRLYSLHPTANAPTMLVAGFPMHRIKGIDPIEDTRRKIQTIAPMTGITLDTATGLGYTAIEAAKTASRVITIELDPTAHEICRCNPWSRDLFENPKIERRIGDSYDLIRDYPDNHFNRILHDPPTLKLAGQLYSAEFYAQLHRTLRDGGKLFHYIGDLNSGLGSTIMRGAMKRLQEAGFTKVTKKPEAFGVLALK
jgi:predicted methyltransferase